MDKSLCNVNKKISCVFKSVVTEEIGTKRKDQSFKVAASNELQPAAVENGIHDATATEKLDGTCVRIDNFNDTPWLWARHDRKPLRAVEKRFRKFQSSRKSQEDKFPWDVATDFKEPPEHWQPALGLEVKDDVVQPDAGGHIMGWVPVLRSSRQYCWHAATVDFNSGCALLLEQNGGELRLIMKPLKDMLGATLELIGTMVNGNPYRLGSKAKPVHMLVRHGALPIHHLVPLDLTDIRDWFAYSEAGQMEGVVWHCSNRELYKIHRHHVNLPWPVDKPRLLTLNVRNDVTVDCVTDNADEFLKRLSQEYGRCYKSLSEISLD